MSMRPHYSTTPLETARRFGVVKGLLALLVKLSGIRPVVLVTRDRGASGWSPSENDGIRRATPDDEGLFEAAGFPGMLQRKLEDGPGWVCVVDGQLVAWCFLASHQCQIADWLVIRTDNANAICGAGTWVRRDYRGGGLASEIRGHSTLWYMERGCREQIAWIDLTNYSSRRSSQKLGAREIGRVALLRLLGVQLVHDGRRWHLGRWTASRPLVLSIEGIRRDRPKPVYSGAAAASPSAVRRS